MVAGGQTGVDQAALATANELGLATGLGGAAEWYEGWSYQGKPW